MLFGLSNAPVSFQGHINKIFVENLDIFVIIYLNNILIYIDNLSQPYVEVMHQILKIFWKYGFFVNLKKYQFYQNQF